jgi:mRNA interferase HigB
LRYRGHVRVITRRRLIEFAQQHPDARTSLHHWFAIVRKTDYSSFADLRITFPSADQVGLFTVFNIGGNKYRLIVAIHYNRKKVYIRHLLTHAEYDRGTWRK